jgi:hypothetical protein
MPRLQAFPQKCLGNARELDEAWIHAPGRSRGRSPRYCPLRLPFGGPEPATALETHATASAFCPAYTKAAPAAFFLFDAGCFLAAGALFLGGCLKSSSSSSSSFTAAAVWQEDSAVGRSSLAAKKIWLEHQSKRSGWLLGSGLFLSPASQVRHGAPGQAQAQSGRSQGTSPGRKAGRQIAWEDRGNAHRAP